MSDTARPNVSDLKADWVDYVRSLDPFGNQGDPEAMTKDDLIALADDLETADPADGNSTDTETAGTDEAGETRTATETGSADTDTDTDGGGVASGYDTPTAGPSDLPSRTSTSRSATTSAVTDRAPEDAAGLADQQTPSASERVMGLPDSPTAAETGTGH